MTDNKLPVLEEIYEESNKLYILFGGIAAGMGMPPFEFYKSSQILKENKIFLRDFSQSWYQCGLPGIGKNAFDISNYLNGKIKKIQPAEIFFVGNSMGGFAAILFAGLLRCGNAIAFCPQTFISPVRRFFYRDWRWKKQILSTYKRTLFRKPKAIYDLKKILSENDLGYSVEIHVSKNDRRDLIHAKRIEDLKQVHVHKYELAGHNLVKLFRDNGQLHPIMKGSLYREKNSANAP